MAGTDSESSFQSSTNDNRTIVFDLIKRNPIYLISLVVVGLYILYSLIYGLYFLAAGAAPPEVNLSRVLLPPSFQYPFGTDDLGRNLLYVVLDGAPIDAAVSVTIIVLSFIIGLVSGSIAGYAGGIIDEMIMRVTDIFLAFPGLVLAVAVAAALGPGLLNSVAAIMIIWWPVYTRLARGEAVSIKQNQFILAARAAGVSRFSIVTSHVIPNLINPMVAYATADVGNVIILFAVLGYLGLGAQPPLISLGRIVYDGENYLQYAPWYSILPGFIIFVIVVSFAFVGDLMRDFFDPRLRR
jgi:peptide/nickel transport system permease protein